MTICIAAICDDGKTIVAAADRMVTLGGLSLEVERSRSKIAELGGSVALSAGDGIMAEEIIDRTRQLMVGNTAIDSVVLSLPAAYVAARDRLINARLLRPIGYQHVQQLLNDGQKQLGASSCCASAIQNALPVRSRHGDPARWFWFPRGASVAHVTNPGTMRWVNAVEFFAIGSGSMHAMLSLMRCSATARCVAGRAVRCCMFTWPSAQQRRRAWSRELHGSLDGNGEQAPSPSRSPAVRRDRGPPRQGCFGGRSGRTTMGRSAGALRCRVYRILDLVSAPGKGRAPLFAQPKRDNYDIIDAASVREATPEEERLEESRSLREGREEARHEPALS